MSKLTKTSLATALALASLAFPAIACTIAQPPRQEAGESGSAFEARRKQYEDEARATPEQRERARQTWYWDNADVTFLARVEKIKVKGQIYPRPPRPIVKVAGRPIPPRIEPVPYIDFGESHSAFIRPVRVLKGEPIFKATWRYVGGTTSCGGTPDGSLGWKYPGSEVIIFGSWVTNIDGRKLYLNLYGLSRDEIVEPRLRAAIRRAPK